MQTHHRFKSKWILLSAFVLFVCVAASMVVLAGKMGTYLLDDSGAVPLNSKRGLPVSDKTASPAALSTNSTPSPSKEPEQGAGEQNRSSEAGPQQTQLPKAPGFQAGDDTSVWTTDTQVEIFRVSYIGGERIMTVKSDDGDKLIAPGTENSYTFKLKNTGNTALDYTVAVDAYFTPDDIAIPVAGRINRYDGQWIAGDKSTYADVAELNRAEDKATLGAGRYTYYTLDWLWPFESGDDGLDTLLGNMALDQDFIFTIKITTTAQESADPNTPGGILSPETGDTANLTLWFALCLTSLAMFMLPAFLSRRRKEAF